MMQIYLFYELMNCRGATFCTLNPVARVASGANSYLLFVRKRSARPGVSSCHSEATVHPGAKMLL